GGGRPARWAAVDSVATLKAAVAEIGTPAILKTARFGYDGKGQVRINRASEVTAAWDAIGGPSVLEGFVDFSHEFSILIVRAADGSTRRYDPPHNVHRDAILRSSILPAPAPVLAQAEEATDLAIRIAEALGYIGVLACEFFVGPDGPVFNEMAPRVHNSGHWTIEGAETSQFENHIRAITGLPLGSTKLTGAHVTLENLIGDDPWLPALSEDGAHLHLYGKGEARPGRKMGHITRISR
ncbi:MAG: ATP-grasp domain-containing protein, partial [Sphingomonas bacterium]|nr:ATP-grasp domain-containing protein [Sphingomonas bacterium]